MSHFDERLQTLYAQVSRKKQLEVMLADLHAQRESLSLKVKELEAIKIEEQAQADKLENGSLAAFFYSVVGKKDEKLNKEREEAYAAQVKYDAAAKEFSSVELSISQYSDELRNLDGCEGEYEKALAAKLEEVKASGSETAEKILNLEKEIQEEESQKREIEEALYEGRIAREMADNLWNKLDSAGGWATFDLLGGGLIADMIKHDRLREAQDMVENLQVQLRRFKTELADISVSADIQATIEGFLLFADYLFDGLFVDWIVADKIEKAQNQTWDTITQVHNTIKVLESMKEAAEENQLRLKKQIENLVVG